MTRKCRNHRSSIGTSTAPKKVRVYDQEPHVPQSHNIDQPMARRLRVIETITAT